MNDGDLPPIPERECDFTGVGWCIPDGYVRMLHRTDFTALGLPPQDLIDIRRMPYQYKPHSKLNEDEYDAPDRKDKATGQPRTLLNMAEFVCNSTHIDITKKPRFLAWLPFLKDLDQWPSKLLAKLQVREIKEAWPDSIKDNIVRRKTAEELRRELKKEESQAKKRKRESDKAAKLQKSLRCGEAMMHF
ncbi:MAG: hypothetical protein SGILL_008768 [Bacillariaceae sp.]